MAKATEPFSNVMKHLTDEDFIERALASEGPGKTRNRKLPLGQVVWLVVGMALFRNLSITEIVRVLELTLPDAKRRPMTSGAIAQARQRLGAEAMEWLFKETARKWAADSADAHAWRGLRVYGLDGTKFNVPDSPETRGHFGAHFTQNGASGYPLARVVTLTVLRSHLLAEARIAPWEASSEHGLARELLPKVPSKSLVVLDRAFWAADILIPLVRDEPNRHWLTRGRKGLKSRTIKHLGPDDSLVEFDVSKDAHRRDADLPDVWQVRAIKYRRRGFPPQTLYTSLLDPKKYPAKEIVALYHERWEIELGYGEIKRHVLQREEALRSRTVATIYQEIWGLAVAYNLVRLEMERAAAIVRLPPSRLSFKLCYEAIRTELIRLAHTSPGAVPKRLEQLRDSLSYYVIPERRPERSYPREVKNSRSLYPARRKRAR